MARPRYRRNRKVYTIPANSPTAHTIIAVGAMILTAAFICGGALLGQLMGLG